MSVDPVLTIHQTDPTGGTVSPVAGLHLFRVPKNVFRAGQSYGLLHADGGTILVDAVHAVTKPAVDELLARHPPKALLLTHADLLQQAFGTPQELSDWLGGAPVLIHSRDSGNLAGLQPLETSRAILGDLGVAFYHIPGHTPGSVGYLHLPTGYFFAGDAIVGNNYEAAEQDYTHPPLSEEDFLEFVYGWEQVPLDVINAVLPLHGRPGFGPEHAREARNAALLRDRVMRR